MEEIRLTNHERIVEVAEAEDEWERQNMAAGHPFGQRETARQVYIQERVCHAQLRKVVVEYDRYLDEPIKGADCPCDACRTRRFVEALRAAGGE